ncbi:hypothetical protein ABT326_39715, partial [Streptomyces sp. NPDC000931]
YAAAALRAGCPYVNFTPSTGLHHPALAPLAAFDHVYRTVAALPGNDAEALAACVRGQAARPFQEEPRPVGVPMLLVSGARDTVAEGAAGLAERCGGSFVEIPGRDHANAVSSRVFKQAAVGFLDD